MIIRIKKDLNIKKVLLLAIVSYVVSLGLTLGILSLNGAKNKGMQVISPATVTPAGSKFKIDPSIPKDQICPLNGEKYTKQEKEIWLKRRPLLVMIENHQDSRPQSGLSSSDIVYEAVAEGGITRFMAVFYCGASAEDTQLGPVRSARTYYIDFASEYGSKPIYVHVGGANTPGPANALGQIEDYGWAGVNDFNQFSIGFPTFWRDYDRLGHEVATEHTMYTTTEKLWAYAEKKRGLTNIDQEDVSWDKGFTPYSFKDDEKEDSRPGNFSLSFVFWERYTDYGVVWKYDKTTNSYLRENGGQIHKDRNNNNQLTAKNIVVLYMNEQNANDGYANNAHLLYKTKGAGTAKVYIDGKVISAKWQKKDRLSHLLITNANTGEELKFNRGRIWFEVLATGTNVLEQ
jgi:hypothetical protein